jgi:hypothetical protein
MFVDNHSLAPAGHQHLRRYVYDFAMTDSTGKGRTASALFVVE